MRKLTATFAVCLSAFIGFGAQASDFEKVQTDKFVADYTSAEEAGKYGVLVLGGSGGGKPEHLAKKIADMGYPVLSLAYFKTEGLPGELNEIPLEYFDAPKEWLQSRSDTKNDGVIVVGWSKGAELALLLASKNTEYKAVVGIAPSNVVWAGILNDWTKVPSSSWTSSDAPLNHVPFAQGVAIKKLTDLYAASLKQTELVSRARIKAENINAPVLLLSGGQDEIWPAGAMADDVCLSMKKAEKNCTHIAYPDAGHLLDETIIIGGTKEANAAANIDSKIKISNFLKAIH